MGDAKEWCQRELNPLGSQVLLVFPKAQFCVQSFLLSLSG